MHLFFLMPAPPPTFIVLRGPWKMVKVFMVVDIFLNWAYSLILKSPLY